ncbi:hypothetical protein MLD38_032448 [Melastoma candidum]|uniref:Uncharacterized protein n=1 Tax=Melastoma candidum TaxID=119954 RepID=A0ACB9M796_9MYRT|nr:hypothetical protein MLD38_032448 [Melastoma candidum]
MALSTLRRVIGVVKDQTSIGLAKVSSSSLRSDLDIAIVKATRHDGFPAKEKHVREILSLTTYSRSNISACVHAIARRLHRTRNWTVALKALVLVQRLLVDGEPAYEQEIFFTTWQGTRLLNMSEFRDTSSRSDSWDFSAFVRTYALYLDEKLDYRMHTLRKKQGISRFEEDKREEEHVRHAVRSTPRRERKTEDIFLEMQQLQQLLERFLACRPTGEAKVNRVVFTALNPIVKESFQICGEMTAIITVLIDRFPDFDVPNCVKTYEIFCRVQKQVEDLYRFYSWCKHVGIARTSEYPEVDVITQKKLDLMDEFIRDKLEEAQREKARRIERKHEKIQTAKLDDVAEQDMFSIKALPPPEGFNDTMVPDRNTEQGENRGNVQQEADLLDLGSAPVTCRDQGEILALALFGDTTSAGPGAAPAWEAFSDNRNKADWETALVQSVSNLSNQRTTMGGGFDMLLLNGMYQHGAMSAAVTNTNFTGSASSIAYGSDGRSPSILALPAPPTPNERTTNYFADPFAPSMTIMPPLYVQMSDMEKKQQLLVEEQLMWQRYTRDGMPGWLGSAQLQANQHTVGGYGYGHGYGYGYQRSY